MRRRLAVCVLIAVGIKAVMTDRAVAAQQLRLEDLLAVVGRYVAEYQKSFSVVVSREHYVQRSFEGSKQQTRDLRSEVALVAVGDADWVLFRDVYQVDGRSVNDRPDRLTSLFLKPSADLGQQARRILDEGARYNLGAIIRTLNTPTQALEFVRPENQSRSTFRLGGRTAVDGHEAYELRFQETAVPRMIVTRDAAAANGRLWASPSTGAILRTELQVRSAGVTATIRVDFTRQESLALWVPSRMTESYEPAGPGSTNRVDMESSAGGERIDGTATYTDFRRFAVDTKTIIK